MREGNRVRPIGTPDDYSGGRIERIDPATGAVERLCDACDGHRLRGPNDLVFDDQSGFYFTDLGKSRARDCDHGGAYCARADGSRIVRVAHPVLTSNGCGLLRQVATSDVYTTNICFGGPNPRAAYVTLSWQDALAELRSPNPGLLLQHQRLTSL